MTYTDMEIFQLQFSMDHMDAEEVLAGKSFWDNTSQLVDSGTWKFISE